MGLPERDERGRVNKGAALVGAALALVGYFGYKEATAVPDTTTGQPAAAAKSSPAATHAPRPPKSSAKPTHKASHAPVRKSAPKPTHKPTHKPVHKVPTSLAYGTKVVLYEGTYAPAVGRFKGDANRIGCRGGNYMWTGGYTMRSTDIDAAVRIQKRAGLDAEDQYRRVGPTTAAILTFELSNGFTDCGKSFQKYGGVGIRCAADRGAAVSPGTVCFSTSGSYTPVPNLKDPQGCPSHGDNGGVGGNAWANAVRCPARPGQPDGEYQLGRFVAP